MPKAWTDLYSPAGGDLMQQLSWTSTTTDLRGGTRSSSGSTRHLKDYALRYDYSKNKVNAQGWREPSSYRRIVAEVKHTPADYTISSPATTTRYEGFPTRTSDRMWNLVTYPLTTVWGCDSTDEVDRAVTECLLRLKEKKVDLGAALAESVKSVNMVADAAKGLWELLLMVKRGRMPKSLLTTYGVSSTYLQYKYGWRPLLSDLHQVYQLSRETLLDGRWKTFSATRNISQHYESSEETSYWTSRKQKVHVIGGCKLWARVSDSFLTTAGQYGLSNPLSLGWELIPFSFVVDWGMPIGNYLEALNASAGLTFVGGFKSIRAEGTCQGRLPGSGQRQGTEVDFLSYRRTKLTAFPRPVVYAKSPFSTSNVSSALALYRQLLK